jgi:hypothetical protein
MAVTLSHLSKPPSRAANPRWRATGVWLVLAAGSCSVAAQPSTTWPGEPPRAVSVIRANAFAATSAIEVTAERSLVLARAAPLATLDGRTSNDLAGVTYRVWSGHGRTALGLGVGTLGYVVPSADGRLPMHTEAPQALVGAVPAVSLGVRYSVSSEHAVFADASRARSLGAGPPRTYVGTKVGVEWKPAKSTLGLEQGAFGMQLESGYKLSLKVRHGGPSVYLRGKF